MSNESLEVLLNEASNLTKLIIERDGEIDEEIDAFLCEIEGNLAFKLDKYAYLIDDLGAKSKFFKEKADVYHEASRALSNVTDRIKDRIKSAMIKNNKKELIGAEIRFVLSNSKPRMIFVEADVPMVYKTQVISHELDKLKIQEDLNMGITIPGVKSEEVKSLRKYLNR